MATGKTVAQHRVRTQRRRAWPRALDRIRAAARKDRARRLTARWHHVYALERRREAYDGLNREASPGGDGATWASSGAHLEANLRHLADRLKRGTDHASPGERVYLPKADGRQRPSGIPTREDTIVQRATVEGLNAIDAQDVRGFSDGFRPGRRPHEALEAVTVGIEKRHLHWGLDGDIRGCFAAIAHAWVVQFVEQRIGDRRVVRHRWRGRQAGGLEDGQWRAQEDGTPQGGSMSPVAATISRHDGLDLWAERWRRRDARGDRSLGRVAEDAIVGVEHRDDAVRCWAARRERCQPCHLERHPEQTRLIACGRVAAERRQRRGQGRPATFDVLGLTPMGRQTRTGKCTVRRQTIATRLRQTRPAVNAALRERRHWPIPQQGAGRRRVRRGPYRD